MSDINKIRTTLTKIISTTAITDYSSNKPDELSDLAEELNRYRYYLFETIDLAINKQASSDTPVFDIIYTANRLALLLEDLESLIKNYDY
ncbi:hypothetical protein HCO87_000934 [Salmonella enterica subsp. enterica serovar Reading]|nr:hypothetical protein [Salmonella enterica subsp. enterica serovar Reading]